MKQNFSQKKGSHRIFGLDSVLSVKMFKHQNWICNKYLLMLILCRTEKGVRIKCGCAVQMWVLILVSFLTVNFVSINILHFENQVREAGPIFWIYTKDRDSQYITIYNSIIISCSSSRSGIWFKNLRGKICDEWGGVCGGRALIIISARPLADLSRCLRPHTFLHTKKRSCHRSAYNEGFLAS